MSDPTTDIPYYPGLNSSDARNPASVSRAINNLLQGSLNVTRNLNVPDVAVSPITLQDSRIHPLSFIQLMPFGLSAPDFTILEVREGEVDIGWTEPLIDAWDIRMLIIG